MLNIKKLNGHRKKEIFISEMSFVNLNMMTGVQILLRESSMFMAVQSRVQSTGIIPDFEFQFSNLLVLSCCANSFV